MSGRRQTQLAITAMLAVFALLIVTSFERAPEKATTMLGSTLIMAFFNWRTFNGAVWAQRVSIVWMAAILLTLLGVGYRVNSQNAPIGLLMMSVAVAGLYGLFRFWTSPAVAGFLAAQRASSPGKGAKQSDALPPAPN